MAHWSRIMEIKSERVETLLGPLYRTSIDDIIIYESSVIDFPVEMLHALRYYDTITPGTPILIWIEPVRHIVGEEIVTTYDLWGKLQDDSNCRSVLLARNIAATEPMANILRSAFVVGTEVIGGKYDNP